MTNTSEIYYLFIATNIQHFSLCTKPFAKGAYLFQFTFCIDFFYTHCIVVSIESKNVVDLKVNILFLMNRYPLKNFQLQNFKINDITRTKTFIDLHF